MTNESIYREEKERGKKLMQNGETVQNSSGKNIFESEKEAFVVYESVLDVLSALPDEYRNKAMWAIIDYGITGECDVDGELLIPLRPIFNSILSQKRRYRNLKCVNAIISEAYQRLANRTDKNWRDTKESIINCLKKIAVDCQREDCTSESVLFRVCTLVTQANVANLLALKGNDTPPGGVPFIDTESMRMLWAYVREEKRLKMKGEK